MFTEIPRLTTPKLEVATTEENNPILQDTRVDKKSGATILRFYGKHTLFNYGMIPKTWENSKIKDKETGCFGDNDPLDIVELGD